MRHYRLTPELGLYAWGEGWGRDGDGDGGRTHRRVKEKSVKGGSALLESQYRKTVILLDFIKNISRCHD